MTELEQYIRERYNKEREKTKELHKPWLVVSASIHHTYTLTRPTMHASDSGARLASEAFFKRSSDYPIVMILDLAHEDGFSGAWPYKFGTLEDLKPLVGKPFICENLRPDLHPVTEIGARKNRRPTPSFIRGVVDGTRDSTLSDLFTKSAYKPQLVMEDGTHDSGLPGVLDVLEADFQWAHEDKYLYQLVYYNTGTKHPLPINCMTLQDVAREYTRMESNRAYRLAFALDVTRDLAEQILHADKPFVSWASVVDNPIVSKNVLPPALYAQLQTQLHYQL